MYLICTNDFPLVFRKIMSPKRKSQTPINQDHANKKNHLEDEKAFSKNKTGFGENTNKGEKTKVCLKQENNDFIPRNQFGQQKLSDEANQRNPIESSSLELNQLLQQKSKLSFYGNVCWKTFLFPTLSQIGSIAKGSLSYFGLDLVDEETERTIWTHKASVWKDIFQSIFELADSGKSCQTISKIFCGILACPVRSTPNGPNEPETFMSSKGQMIQHLIILIPMPADIDTSEFIPLCISELSSLCKKTFIRSAYHYQVSNISKHPGLLNQIQTTGSYWNILEEACQNDVATQRCDCLSEVLMNSTIKEVISLGLGVSKDTNTWSDSIKHYAFGV